MGMPVDYHVDSPGIANNVVGSPAVRDAVLPQMPNQNHVIRARIPGRIYRILNLIVQALPALILAEAINIISIGILEIGRCGLGKALRGGRSHKRHFGVPVCKHPVRLKDRGPGGQIHKVAGCVAASQLSRQFHKPRHPVVVLMVSGNGEIISHFIHNFNDIPAVRDCADGRSLNGIPRVHQGHIGRLLLHLLFVERKPGITDVVVHPAVHIIGIQNHNVMICGKGGKGTAESKGHDHQKRQPQ